MKNDLVHRPKLKSNPSSATEEQLYTTVKYITLNSTDYELALTRQTDLYSSMSSRSAKSSLDTQAYVTFKNERRVTRALHIVCSLIQEISWICGTALPYPLVLKPSGYFVNA
jgi:hypothetical protein